MALSDQETQYLSDPGREPARLGFEPEIGKKGKLVNIYIPRDRSWLSPLTYDEKHEEILIASDVGLITEFTDHFYTPRIVREATERMAQELGEEKKDGLFYADPEELRRIQNEHFRNLMNTLRKKRFWNTSSWK